MYVCQPQHSVARPLGSAFCFTKNLGLCYVLIRDAKLPISPSSFIIEIDLCAKEI